MKPAILAAVVLTAGLTACGERSRNEPATTESAPAAAAAPAAPTGSVIAIKMISDDKGNYFEPKEVEAKPGDVLRLTLVSGVHNFHFPAEKNPGVQGLPPATELLQLPGQTLDVPVTLTPGEYFFQCDPHAALGMTGELEVEDDD
ncbi:MAG TPA: plastocyanin/azurin family copper-binding protein [Gemmatimonadales bacterium]|nr:plastocyanin/azurin family copper-binding protein [Gemmatimonadales bacterium]